MNWLNFLFFAEEKPEPEPVVEPEPDPEPEPEPEPEPVVEPEVGEYWVAKPEDEGPFSKEKDVSHCLIVEVKSGWVRFASIVEHSCEISSFINQYIKSDTIPVTPKPGELWDLKSNREKDKEDDPFPSDGPLPPKKPFYTNILAVKDGWVQFQWGEVDPSEKTHRERIVSFTNSYYNTGHQLSTPEVDKSEEVV